jgi:hypothetical protein
VALAMPATALITHAIRLPAGLPEEQLEILVELEAAQYMPFALEDASLVLSPWVRHRRWRASQGRRSTCCWWRRGAQRAAPPRRGEGGRLAGRRHG